MLHIDVVTLFPEIFAPSIGLSILGRAQERGVVQIALHHLLDALVENERADDRPFGGGPGMVLRLEPLARVLDGILADAPPRRTACRRRDGPPPERPSGNATPSVSRGSTGSS